MITLLNYLPILLAIGCYALAAAFKADPSTHEGLTLLAGALVGMAVPRLGDAIRKAPPTALFLLALLVFPKAATADGQVIDQTMSGQWKQTLTVGAIATMVNLSSGEVVLGAPLGTCYGVTYTPFKSGVAGCFHLNIATKDTPNRYIPSLQLNYHEAAGIGLGLMKKQGEAGWPMVLYLSGAFPVL